jgi:hypothetical protein
VTFDLFDGAEAGGAQAVTSPVLSGIYAYELSPPVDTVQKTITAGERTMASSFAFRFNTVPGVSANRPIVAEWRGGTHGSNIRFNCTTQRLQLREPDAAEADFGPTILANTWYLVDVSANYTANPWVLKGRATAVGSVWDGTEASLNGARAATDITGFWIGSNSAGDSYTAYYDNLWISSIAYPLGPYSPPPTGGGGAKRRILAQSFAIDGRPVPLFDWQCDATVDWGDRTLTGKLPHWVTWAQQGSEIVAWRGADDAMWAGELTADPRDTGEWLAIRAHGFANRIAEDSTRMFYRIDGGEAWIESDADPHEYVFAGIEKFDLNSKRNQLAWKVGDGSTDYAINDRAGWILWVEGGLINGYTMLVEVSGNFADMNLQTLSGTGPNGSLTVERTHSLALGAGGTATYTDTFATPSDLLCIRTNVTGAFTPARRQRVKATRLKVYGRTTDDNFSVSDVVNDVGSNAGLLTDKVRTHKLHALPLDWTEDHTDLLTYLAELTDWRWLVRHDGLHFGPYEKEWDVYMPGDGVGDLEPERRFNRVEQPFRTLSGRLRRAIGVPAVEPYPGETFTLRLDELIDPQSSSSVADAVAETRADYEASRRLSGSLELARIRDEGEALSPYFISPGDLLRIPNLAPDVAPQRVKSVTYRPNDRVTVDLGTGFNVVRTLAEAAKKR